MRLNKFLAQYTPLSRRGADEAIASGRVTVNGVIATLGTDVKEKEDIIKFDSKRVDPNRQNTTIIMNKPVGYVCSKNGQGNKTVYDLLPEIYHQLNIVGRLDKDSSGLLMLTNDGNLANQLTHPKFGKEKVYHVSLARELDSQTISKINRGISLEDGISNLHITPINQDSRQYKVVMSEGKNRQIRRTIEAVGNSVIELRRVKFGDYEINSLKPGEYQVIK